MSTSDGAACCEQSCGLLHPHLISTFLSTDGTNLAPASFPFDMDDEQPTGAELSPTATTGTYDCRRTNRRHGRRWVPERRHWLHQYLEYSLDRHGLPRAFFYIWLNRSADALRKLSQIIQWTFKPHTLCPVFLTSTDHPCHLPKWYRYQSRPKRKTTALIVWGIYLDLQHFHFVTPLRTESVVRTEKNGLGSWVSLDCQPGRLSVSSAQMSHAASLTWP